ncbi:hypothetical protein D3C77_651390 [compost metagenome]
MGRIRQKIILDLIQLEQLVLHFINRMISLKKTKNDQKNHNDIKENDIGLTKPKILLHGKCEKYRVQ